MSLSKSSPTVPSSDRIATPSSSAVRSESVESLQWSTSPSAAPEPWTALGSYTPTTV